jgi:tetratricopeptide (TPR) repeat protein
MSSAFSRSRRLLLVAFSLAIAAMLFRSQVAQALVVRGDDFLSRGRSGDALLHYARALRIDPGLNLAVDRYVFASMQRHTTGALQSAVSTAGKFLARHPNDATLLTDRALCYIVERRYELARRDFEAAARASSNPRDYVFAGWAALHSGDARAARRLWRRALALDKRFEPARVALEERAK